MPPPVHPRPAKQLEKMGERTILLVGAWGKAAGELQSQFFQLKWKLADTFACEIENCIA
jgi:hypothetical protein